MRSTPNSRSRSLRVHVRNVERNDAQPSAYSEIVNTPLTMQGVWQLELEKSAREATLREEGMRRG